MAKQTRTATADTDGELASMEKGRDLIRVTESDWQGMDLIDVRVYYEDQKGALRPTRKGIAVRKEAFADFAAMIEEARAVLDKPKAA